MRALLCLLLAAPACPPAAVETPPAPPATQVVQPAGCFSPGDCAGGEICVDPRYPVCGNIPACEDGGLIRCGCACAAVCSATSCAADEVCGAGGCCEPRVCEADAQCGSEGARCVAGRCLRRGTCTVPPL